MVVAAPLIAQLFSPSCCTAEGVPKLADESLYPEEMAYIARAVPKRRAEFTSARTLARQALRALGEPPMPLVPRTDRSPVWPAGVVGSISHTNDYCAVVVNRATRLRSIGVDVEMLRPFEASLWRSIMTAREQEWVRQQPASTHNDLALLHFSAKEAFYKCQYPLTTEFLDFLDVELDVDLGAGRFSARVVRPGWASAIRRLEGRFVRADGRVLCGVELPCDPVRA